jgi:hypothetical protein
MVISRKLTVGETEVANLIDTADFLGLNIIELRWNEEKSYPPRVYGFDVPKVRKVHGVASSDPNNIKYVNEPIMFYPDVNNRCWAYVVDTPTNRMYLKNSFSSGWYTIQDKEIREKLKAEAEAEGIGTKTLPKPEIHVKVNADELVADISNKEDEIRRLKAELSIAARKIDTLTEAQSAFEIKKPLAGVRIDKSRWDKTTE